MKYRRRIHYTEADKALMWDRWQKGDSMATIARSTIFPRVKYNIVSLNQKQCNPTIHTPSSGEMESFGLYVSIRFGWRLVAPLLSSEVWVQIGDARYSLSREGTLAEVVINDTVPEVLLVDDWFGGADPMITSG